MYDRGRVEEAKRGRRRALPPHSIVGTESCQLSCFPELPLAGRSILISHNPKPCLPPNRSLNLNQANGLRRHIGASCWRLATIPRPERRRR